MNCRDCQSVLPDLLLDPAASSNSRARAHVDSCDECRLELESLQATMSLLDAWEAPEPSPYFDQKLAVLLREEQEKAPAGWFERMRSRLLFNTGRQFRPAIAGVFALALLIGGGTFADFASHHVAKPQISAAVTDLQVLDNNDQALQTMDQIFQDENSADEVPAIPAS
ncbi:MAG TPA: hypothetical protein VL495_09565 [Edaphobacter sp.]|jgi:hypothetical protein|nr:hypothetical protein [Edaphobacter sp.]